MGKKGKKEKTKDSNVAEDVTLPLKKATKSRVAFQMVDSEEKPKLKSKSTVRGFKSTADIKSSATSAESTVSMKDSSSMVCELDESLSSEETIIQPERKKSRKSKKDKKGEKSEKREKKPKKKSEKRSDESGKKKKKKKTDFKEVDRKSFVVSGKEIKIDLTLIRAEELGTLTVDKEIMATEVEEPKKKKKKRKKKLSKEEKKKLEAEQMEEEARRIQEEKQRLEEEKLKAIEKYSRQIFEEDIREDQIVKSMDRMDKIYESYTDLIREEKTEEEWKRYIACERLPNPTRCDEMTTYIHLWDEVILKTTIEEAAQRTRDVLLLLNQIDAILDRALPEDESNTDKLKWIHQMLREHQDNSLTVATYQLLLWVEKKLNRIDVSTADFHFKDENIIFSIWLRIQLPIPLPNPRRPPKPRIDISFPNIPMQVILPPKMDCAKMAIRGMHLKYDHLSDQCNNYYLPCAGEDFKHDLLAHVKYEWRIKQKYRYIYRDVPNTQTQTQISQGKSAVSDKTDKSDKLSLAPSSTSNLTELIIKALEKLDNDAEFQDEDEDIPVVPYQRLEPSASNLFLVKDFTTHQTMLQNFTLDLPIDIVNLRDSVILGGIFYFNIVYQPPQPQEFVTLELVLSRFFLPKELEYYQKHITSPEGSLSDERIASSLSSRSSHLISGVQETRSVVAGTKSALKMEELRKSKASDLELSRSVALLKEEQKKSRMSLTGLTEKDMKTSEEPDDLIQMTIAWPRHVLFFDLPRVCYWEDSEKCWSTRNIYQVKHNQENNTVVFKTDVLGAFAFANPRYIHLPYKKWKVKTRPDGSVIIILRAAIMNFQFNIKNGLICLDTYEIYPNPILKPLEKVYMKLSKLMRKLKELGIDIFPEPDAICYINGHSEKLWPFEKHLYCDMARLYTCFNFASSKFNPKAGRRNILFQMKQTFLAKSKYYSLVHVSPLKVTYLQCNEDSEEFSYDEMENMRFASDLYHHMKNTSGIIVRNHVLEAPPDNVVTLAEFLIATRVFSFSEQEQPLEEVEIAVIVPEKP